ncbi:MAG: trans-sulfuration enzyme family protein [Pseudomarimonas sp.]
MSPLQHDTLHPHTQAVHAGGAPDPSTGALSPPLHMATTFQHGPAGERIAGFEYQREGNPTQERLETALATLEGGAAALSFATGMAAMSAMLDSVPPGSHIVIPSESYGGLRSLATEFLPARGVETSIVDMADLRALANALRGNTRLVWIETPSNPLLAVTDIRAVVALAMARGSLIVCDNTFATPLLQQPLALGAHIVMHSTTKYFGGHSDVMGGALVFARRDERFEALAHRRHITGATLSPFNAWLTLRGCRSLPARLAWHCRNAKAVASALEAHSAVSGVNYPGLASHAGHAIARQQMSDFGGMLSFTLHGGRDAALAVAGALKLIVNATSLGGCESLIEHRASVEGPNPTSPQNLLRMSVGLEHAEDLVADLIQALDSI